MIHELLQELALKDHFDVAAAQRGDEVLGAHDLRLPHLLISSGTSTTTHKVISLTIMNIIIYIILYNHITIS